MTQLPSLIDETITVGVPAKAPRRLRLDVPDAWKSRWRAWIGDPIKGPKRRRAARFAGIFAALCVVGAGVWAVLPRQQPDYMDDPIDDVFDYTLLSDDFNNLPLDERLRLIGQLVSRLKGMSSEDSVLMAAFASGIAGQARKQLEENASRLAIDMWDKYAVDYSKVPESDREKYLESTFVEFTKTMETLAGEQSDSSDDERVAEAKEQAAREKQRMTSPNGAKPPGEALGMVFDVMNGNVGGHATPQQRKRGAQMMRDMIRHFRGNDPETGKPDPQAAPPEPPK
ncbi:MAG: hypothetical protein ACOYN0_02490 [Phycisphaerales bacterium]